MYGVLEILNGDGTKGVRFNVSGVTGTKILNV